MGAGDGFENPSVFSPKYQRSEQNQQSKAPWTNTSSLDTYIPHQSSILEKVLFTWPTPFRHDNPVQPYVENNMWMESLILGFVR